MKHTYLPTPGNDPKTTQNMNTTKVQHGKPMSVFGITYRTVGEWLCTEADMTQRELHHQGPT